MITFIQAFLVDPGRVEAWFNKLANEQEVTIMESLDRWNGVHIIDFANSAICLINLVKGFIISQIVEKEKRTVRVTKELDIFLLIDTFAEYTEVDFSGATAKHGTRLLHSMESSHKKLPYFLVLYLLELTQTRWLPFRSFDSDGTLAISRCQIVLPPRWKMWRSASQCSKPEIPKTFGIIDHIMSVLKFVCIVSLSCA